MHITMFVWRIRPCSHAHRLLTQSGFPQKVAISIYSICFFFWNIDTPIGSKLNLFETRLDLARSSKMSTRQAHGKQATTLRGTLVDPSTGCSLRGLCFHTRNVDLKFLVLRRATILRGHRTLNSHFWTYLRLN